MKVQALVLALNWIMDLHGLYFRPQVMKQTSRMKESLECAYSSTPTTHWFAYPIRCELRLYQPNKMGTECISENTQNLIRICNFRRDSKRFPHLLTCLRWWLQLQVEPLTFTNSNPPPVLAKRINFWTVLY